MTAVPATRLSEDELTAMGLSLLMVCRNGDTAGMVTLLADLDNSTKVEQVCVFLAVLGGHLLRTSAPTWQEAMQRVSLDLYASGSR